VSGSSDVLIVGAGVIGCMVALEAVNRGLTVTVIEKDAPGRGATWASAGMISPFGGHQRSPTLTALANASIDLWPEHARRLETQTEIDVQYRTDGAVHIALDASAAALLADLAGQGVAQLLTPAEARALEPAINTEVRAGAFVARDHRVNTRRLGMALWSACVAAGVTIQLGEQPAQLVQKRGRFHAVRLSSGGEIAAGSLVIAAGAWSAAIPGLPRMIPVRPVRGQMFSVDAGSPLIHHNVLGAGIYLVPRERAHILVGATVENVGFAPGPTAAGIAELAAAARKVVPRVADLPIIETWAGYRPGTPDDLPILGGDPDVEGVFYATGHYRNGILLAPITAQVIVELLSGGRPAVAIDSFSIERFASHEQSAAT
jgi:glycine oxidase